MSRTSNPLFVKASERLFLVFSLLTLLAVYLARFTHYYSLNNGQCLSHVLVKSSANIDALCGHCVTLMRDRAMSHMGVIIALFWRRNEHIERRTHNLMHLCERIQY